MCQIAKLQRVFVRGDRYCAFADCVGIQRNDTVFGVNCNVVNICTTCQAAEADCVEGRYGVDNLPIGIAERVTCLVTGGSVNRQIIREGCADCCNRILTCAECEGVTSCLDVDSCICTEVAEGTIRKRDYRICNADCTGKRGLQAVEADCVECCCGVDNLSSTVAKCVTCTVTFSRVNLFVKSRLSGGDCILTCAESQGITSCLDVDSCICTEVAEGTIRKRDYRICNADCTSKRGLQAAELNLIAARNRSVSDNVAVFGVGFSCLVGRVELVN